MSYAYHTIDSLEGIQARLIVLKAQMECVHDYEETTGLIACRKCLAYMTVCVSCDMPTFDGQCDWCLA